MVIGEHASNAITRSVGVSEVEQETEESEQDDVGDGPSMTIPEFRERKCSPRMQA